LDIYFFDAETQRLFSTRRLLEARYHCDLSKKIILRMAVLQAASNLASVPTRPPFNLRRIAKSEFLIDLVPPNALRFACDRSAVNDMQSVRAITIVGVTETA
jgi:hypothetical protein